MAPAGHAYVRFDHCLPDRGKKYPLNARAKIKIDGEGASRSSQAPAAVLWGKCHLGRKTLGISSSDTVHGTYSIIHEYKRKQ